MHKGDYAALKINLIYCELLFQNQQYQGGKNWGYTENFMLLVVSNLRTTVFCFGNIELLK